MECRVLRHARGGLAVDAAQRRVLPDGEQSTIFTRRMTGSGTAGQLRLIRQGGEIHCLMAIGDEDRFQWIDSFPVGNARTELQPSIEGTMQGGPLSPMLANFLWDDFDKELESRGLRFVRYAVDFLVFAKTSEASRRVFASLERYLTRKLKLGVNRHKSRVCYYRPVPIKSYFSGQDHWVRRRIRMCIWKSWKTSRTRVASFKLGIPEDAAYNHGMSSKGPWVLSFSPAVHQVLWTALLEERGLPSLSAIWTKLTAKNRIA